MDKQTMEEIRLLKQRVNELSQAISEHYMSLHNDSVENIDIDQDALIELDERISALEERS